VRYQRLAVVLESGVDDDVRQSARVGSGESKRDGIAAVFSVPDWQKVDLEHAVPRYIKSTARWRGDWHALHVTAVAAIRLKA
jgi:hypothetical protein